ncbi:MAG: hypothetical protein ACREDY_02780, partial [Bradyrhizobium sp.]
MSELDTSLPAEAQGGWTPTRWDQTRLSVLLPLGVVVAVAIVCIVVAALTSAQRADDVAIARDQELLTRAIANHGEWSLRRLRNVVKSDIAVSASDIDRSPGPMQSRLSAWLGALIDHRLVVLYNSKDQIVYSQIGQDRLPPATVDSPALQAIVDGLRARAIPQGAIRLATGRNKSNGAVFLQNIDRRLCVVSALAVTPAGARSSVAASSPVVVTVRPIEHDVLGDIGRRLQLTNLRMIDGGNRQDGEHTFAIVDSANHPIARFGW